MSPRLPASLAIALALIGCKRHSDSAGATCDAVGSKFALVARAELAEDKDLDADLAHGVEGLIAPMRDGMVRACREDSWAAGPRDCFATAGDDKAMKACYAQLTPDQRTKLDRAAAGRGNGDDAPADTTPTSR